MKRTKTVRCPECDSTITRREFMLATGAAVVATGAAVLGGNSPAYCTPRLPATPNPVLKGTPESMVKTLYNTLTPEQKGKVALPWDSPKRKMISANWAIVEPTIGKTF